MVAKPRGLLHEGNNCPMGASVRGHVRASELLGEATPLLIIGLGYCMSGSLGNSFLHTDQMTPPLLQE